MLLLIVYFVIYIRIQYNINTYIYKYKQILIIMTGITSSDNLETKPNKNGGMKYDKGKPDWSLAPMKEIQESIQVMTQGAEKYGRFNWKQVEPDRYKSACMRHLTSYMSGETMDESGNTHLAHAVTNLLFLMWLENNLKKEVEK